MIAKASWTYISSSIITYSGKVLYLVSRELVSGPGLVYQLHSLGWAQCGLLGTSGDKFLCHTSSWSEQQGRIQSCASCYKHISMWAIRAGMGSNSEYSCDHKQFMFLNILVEDGAHFIIVRSLVSGKMVLVE